ncbi:MAG: TrkA C-terminal domain-containing protein [Nitrospira sp.]|nr:TrkA C-terminal domain-containing protein [Nitrospira sp.]
MNLEMLSRVRKELTITASALYETILALAERVNRKVQVMQLHWQATTVLQRIDQVAMETGRLIVASLTNRPPGLTQHPSSFSPKQLDSLITHSMIQIRALKNLLVQTDEKIRDLKLEVIHENLLALQHDLTLRSAKIERLIVAPHAAAVGQPLRAWPRSSSVHLVTVMRGAYLLPPSETLVVQKGDILVFIGPELELTAAIEWFTNRSS